MNTITIIAIVVGIFILHGLLTGIVGEIAEHKGYDRVKWETHCMWLGLVSYVIVLTLPNLVLQSALRELSLYQKGLLDAEKGILKCQKSTSQYYKGLLDTEKNVLKYQKSISSTLKLKKHYELSQPESLESNVEDIPEEPTAMDMMVWSDAENQTSNLDEEEYISEEPSLLDIMHYDTLPSENEEEDLDDIYADSDEEDPDAIEAAYRLLQKYRPEVLMNSNPDDTENISA